MICDQMRAIDLAVSAGQKRLSKRTRFVHFDDTIPIYENFCFALALLRQKTAESVTQAKDLLGRLLPFQLECGNFPLYLHEYPKAHDFHLGLRVGAILKYTLQMFAPILGADLRTKIEFALGKILLTAPEKPFWLSRYNALSDLPFEQVKGDVIEGLITAQIGGQKHFDVNYDSQLQLYQEDLAQEGNEPRCHPIEWLLAEGHYSPRLLKDHPAQLLCAPLFPTEFTAASCPQETFSLYWQGKTLHSLVGDGLVFDLTAQEITRNDFFEASLYCDRSAETEITVNERKATTFHLGDQIVIHTPTKTISLHFALTKGEGDFCGHIFPANRPTQKASGFEAYDWQIGLRTLRRSETARIEIIVS